MINNQYSRAISAQAQQLQNVFISENSPQLSETLYFHQQPQLNLSQMNQIQPAHYQNSHSLMATIGGMQQNPVNPAGTAIFDPRLARAYAATNGLPTATNSSSNLISNNLNATIPSQSNAILLNSFVPQLQAEQSQQAYRNSVQNASHFPSTLHLQHSTVSRQQVHHAAEHTQRPHNFEHADIAISSNPSQIMQQHHIASANQPIFLPTDAFGNNANGKISAYLPFKVNSSFPTTINEMYQRQLHSSGNSAVIPTSAVANTTSPVVLDRINICINNHYTDPNFSTSTVDAGGTCASSVADTQSLSSPIIPPIQHSAVIDPSLLMEPDLQSTESNTTTNVTTPGPSTVNEPDSTTTSHTPPLITDNTSSHVDNVTAIQSPSTSSTAKIDEACKDYAFNNTEMNEKSVKAIEQLNQNSAETKETSNVPQEPPQIPIIDLVNEDMFAVGDDVFVKIDNNRLYLGTIIDSKYQRYRVRFDDASEMWCSPKEMRKFGVCEESNNSSGVGENRQDDSDSGALCVACKKRDIVDVEVCERCGRGYHKACTTETIPGSGEWNCKRCSKSMKLDPSEINCADYENCIMSAQRLHLPYDVQSLNWDSKHRVNEEQIYCYCGKSGQFDYNMLQCLKCRNWYHTSCIQDFKSTMLRGDLFFLFRCAICAIDGNEFLRRLQMNCVDFIHLVLYNLSAQRKQQPHKYHHLTRDIWPFVLSQRKTSALPEEWLELSDDDIKDCILSTLKDNIDRFVCGRELKRDYYFYGLRNNGPPPAAISKICVESDQIEEITDKFIVEILKLKLSKRALENRELPAAIKPVPIDCDRHIEKDDTDEKFTSDDEIPIKLILEKEKVKNKAANDTKEHTKQTEDQQQSEKSSTKLEIKSHKRKAFTIFRPYKEPVATEKQARTTTANCESSSDENSSSSRGTSLDLIIPPPKNFLGANNPFRTVATPKKAASDRKSILGRSISGGPTIRNSVVNASGLDFSSNLAALKNAGVLPILNTTTFSRAAGQPRMVRTIKRRLSAKDIKIGPNQEIRRRRTRRLSSNVEVISTTTINPISNFFPINPASSTKTAPTVLRKHNFPTALPPLTASIQLAATKTEKEIATIKKQTATHGRRLRLRPQNTLPTNSRRSSLSGASTSSTSSSSGNATPQTAQYSESIILNDLQQTVNRYFGVGHLIATGEQFSIHAKRQLPNGQIQLLIEWGVNDENSFNTDSTIGTDTGEKTISQENS